MKRWKRAAQAFSLVLPLLLVAACGSAGDGAAPTVVDEEPEHAASGEAHVPAPAAEEAEPEPAPAAEPAESEPAATDTNVKQPTEPEPKPSDGKDEPTPLPAKQEPVKEEPAEVQPQPEPTPPPEKAEPVRHVVEIVDFAFSAERLEIKAGDTVVFINKDSVGHTATAEDGAFDTGPLKQGEEKEIVFTESGEFPYICTPHPAMKAVIVVK
jgi:plastocyanin